MNPSIIQGARVRLIPIDRALHLENCLRVLNDPEIAATLFLNFGITRRQEEAFFDRMESEFGENEFVWGIHDETGRHIGMTGFQPVNWRLRCATGGIYIGERSAWGRGYATETLRLRARFGFDELGLHRIEGHTLNPAMMRVYEKAGYSAEGVAKAKIWRGGRFWDSHNYAILAEDYRRATTDSP